MANRFVVWFKSPANRTKGQVFVSSLLDALGNTIRDRKITDLEKRIAALEQK